MHDLVQRFWHEIADRPSGPLAFRFYFQPFMAFLLALRDGFHDARAGQPPYFWSLTDRVHRQERLREGWRKISKVFVLAFVLDLVYQLFALHGLRPVEGIVIAFVLAIVPYILFRGPTNRIARRVLHAHDGEHPTKRHA